MVALAALSVLGLTDVACGKYEDPPSVGWYTDVDAGLVKAREKDRPAVLYFGAAWDMAAKQLEHETFPNLEVRKLLNDGFVAIYIDMTDADSPRVEETQRRFGIIGDPTILILAPDSKKELDRIHHWVPPQVLAGHLRTATHRFRTRR
jgi:thiol:disulfide interchange protein